MAFPAMTKCMFVLGLFIAVIEIQNFKLVQQYIVLFLPSKIQ
jgi:hypothetical protein